MKFLRLRFLLLCFCGEALAEASPAPVGYALLVGSNAEGPGQTPLRYAEQDARRVAEVLTALGGYSQDRVERLTRPTAAELDRALRRVADALAAHQASGEQVQFFFYYSGHARADALNLGSDAYPLAKLRESILKLPATLSIVVLDACQSGAFSRVKGASPAADFSFNSVDRLNTRGVAVLASSSGRELSQESEELQSGYFTHHLLVGLRGAGDADGDGRVTLAEAYGYAYHRTLSSTALTAVGEQHVTLETDLQGKGEVALTYPARASARIRIPSEVRGRVLIEHTASGSVLAEVDNTAGSTLELAFPPGGYVVRVRQDHAALRCKVSLADGVTTTLELSGCERLALASHRTKTSTEAALPAHRSEGREGFFFELGVGFGGRNGGEEYEQTLSEFGFEREATTIARYDLAAGRRLEQNFAVGLSFFNLDGARYARSDRTTSARTRDGVTQNFQLATYALGAFAQVDTPGDEIRLFARGGAGSVLTHSTFDAIEPDAALADQDPAFEQFSVQTEEIDENQWGFMALLAGGVTVMPSDHFGFLLEGRYVHASALDNEFGETLDVGGWAALGALRLRTWE